MSSPTSPCFQHINQPVFVIKLRLIVYLTILSNYYRKHGKERVIGTLLGTVHSMTQDEKNYVTIDVRNTIHISYDMCLTAECNRYRLRQATTFPIRKGHRIDLLQLIQIMTERY